MEEHKITSSAAALFDGGWRAEDRDQMIAEYTLSEDVADAICKKLAEYAENDTQAENRNPTKSKENAINLFKITGQESGIIIYPEAEVAVVHWADKDGMPHWLTDGADPVFMPLSDSHHDRMLAIRVVSDIRTMLPQKFQVAYDPFGDIATLFAAQEGTTTSGAVYHVGEIIVIAPEGWN